MIGSENRKDLNRQRPQVSLVRYATIMALVRYATIMAMTGQSRRACQFTPAPSTHRHTSVYHRSVPFRWFVEGVSVVCRGCFGGLSSVFRWFVEGVSVVSFDIKSLYSAITNYYIQTTFAALHHLTLWLTNMIMTALTPSPRGQPTALTPSPRNSPPP